MTDIPPVPSSLPTTLGALRASGWVSRPVKEEMRRNAVERITKGLPLFEGVLGYEDTVMPQLENAVLAGHDVVFLGERGQAKTRMIRSLTGLLDEWMPIVSGSEINDDPYNPVSRHALDLVAEKGDDTPIHWVHNSQRFGEKLATPDTSIADLIGEVDPIKVAEGRYLSDELTLHYGLVPRTNRGIFAINELPDLAERIQVGLLNVLEERDVQIRGYKVRLPLDVMLVASANPEDYTNRGRIITPLKDRVGSQIRTHYPRSCGKKRDRRASETSPCECRFLWSASSQRSRILLVQAAISTNAAVSACACLLQTMKFSVLQRFDVRFELVNLMSLLASATCLLWQQVQVAKSKSKLSKTDAKR